MRKRINRGMWKFGAPTIIGKKVFNLGGETNRESQVTADTMNDWGGGCEKVRSELNDFRRGGGMDFWR